MAEPMSSPMRAPYSERTEAIRAHYDEFGFSGPTDLDRERDQVIGHLLGEVTNLGDRLAAENERAENDELRTKLSTRGDLINGLDAEVARLEARLAEIGETDEEWTLGDEHGPYDSTNNVRHEADVRYWADEPDSTSRAWRRLVGEWRDAEAADGDADEQDATEQP